MKKTLLVLLLITTINSFSQNEYSVRFDFVKSMFGIYQTEIEYEKNEKKSYGIGLSYVNTDTMLILKDENSNTNGFMISPFIRYYKNKNSEPSSFYQTSLRFMNYRGFADKDRKRRNIIALDFVYGYQFKINKKIFIEPSVGLGIFRNLNKKNNLFLTPYPILNFNASFKL